MKVTAMFLSLFLLISCKETEIIKTVPETGESSISGNKNCTTVRDDINKKSIITCPDGTVSEVYDGQNGLDGANGQDGADGQDGRSCVATQLENGALIECSNTTVFVSNGKDGVDGQDGANGVDGQNGTNGKDAVVPTSAIIEVINPCATVSLDEILLRMNDGRILGLFTNSQNKSYLSFLINDNRTWFQTTDNTSCVFKIDENWNLIESTGKIYRNPRLNN